VAASPARRTAKLAFRRGAAAAALVGFFLVCGPADGRDAQTASDAWGISSVQTQMNKPTGLATTLTVTRRAQNLCEHVSTGVQQPHKL